MHPRFLAPEATTAGELVTLSREESQHLTRVLRLAPGDLVVLFNGRGGEFDAVVDGTPRAGAVVRVGASRTPVPEPRVAVTLAQAVLKADKMDDVVRDAVMLGVGAIQPILTTRTETSLAVLHRSQRRERWSRIAIASSKQCGRAVVPIVHDPQALIDVLQSIPSRQGSMALMLVEPGAGGGIPLRDLEAAMPRSATLIVGPEGGWTSEELQAAAGIAQTLTLGSRTLRADAMALVALAALFTRWGEF